MNNPSPLIPQGSLTEQKNKTRARVRLAVFFVISVHVVGLMALLMQGCRKPQEEQPPMSSVDTNFPPIVDDTNYLPQPMPDTNVYVPPPVPEQTTPIVEPTPQQPVAPAPTTQEYTVVAGDTLSGIASRFHVTVKQLQDANPTVQPTRMQVGTKLQIPESTQSTQTTGTAPGTTSTSANGEQIYTVKSGDNLTKIAKRYNTTVRAIRSANNLTTDRIKVGQKLKIPGNATAAPAESTPATPPPAAPITTP
jgi:LysM repeat protein